MTQNGLKWILNTTFKSVTPRCNICYIFLNPSLIALLTSYFVGVHATLWEFKPELLLLFENKTKYFPLQQSEEFNKITDRNAHTRTEWLSGLPVGAKNSPVLIVGMFSGIISVNSVSLEPRRLFSGPSKGRTGNMLGWGYDSFVSIVERCHASNGI